ncbi:MAG: carbohydrate kinase family protein [Fimbriimonadaceae bacterium]|nr:carbohydrate kinase family protein [Fimbriimonadaceae bacterium]
MVTVFGTVCLDRVRRVAKLPPAGGYVEIDEEAAFLGGEASNTAVALVAWGNPALLFGNSLGRGPESDLLWGLLRAKGLGDYRCADADAPTPVCEIYVTPDGDRTMFGYGFRHMAGTVDPGATPVRPGDWLTGEPNMGEVAREVMRAGHAAGMRTYFLDFYQPHDPITEGSFWQSSTDWVGERGNFERNERFLREWVDRHGCFGVLSDGPQGFWAGSPTYRIRHYPAYPCPSVVDTTGAGDVFRAGMLHGLCRGWTIADCLRFASVAGCLNCRFLGAADRVPTVAEIEAHLAAHPAIGRTYEP